MTQDPLSPLFYDVFLHADNACLLVSAHDMLIQDINISACKLVGHVKEKILNTPLSSIECSLQDIFFWEELNADFNKMKGLSRIIESEWLIANGDAIPIEKRVLGMEIETNRYWLIYVKDIREKHRIAQEQLVLASQLQSTLEATVDGIMSVDTYGNILHMNRQFSELLVLTSEQIVSANEHSILQHLLNLLSDTTKFDIVISRIEQNKEVETEITLSLIDGRYFVFNSKPEYLRDKLAGRLFSLRDISAMKKVEQDLVQALSLAETAVEEKSQMLDALKVSESRLRRLINSSLIGICQGFINGRLTLINDALIQLIGSNRQNILNDPTLWPKHLSQSYQDSHQKALNELQTTGQAQPFYTELVHQRGHSIPVMVGLAQLEGSDFEWVGFVLDLSEQTKADKMKSEFISVVSHELRTPITSIRGALSILDSGIIGNIAPQFKQLIEIAHRNSQRLLLLVNDLLDMEKLISGKMSFKSQAFNLIELAQQAMEANTAYAAAFEVKYKLELETKNGMAMGDPERTMQVFANLLSNAAKFSPPLSEVILKIIDKDNTLLLEVIDKGQGIPEEFRDRIFTKFAQADESNTRKQGGTGLGLCISKNIIEAMSGKIGFTTERGKGTTFWFSLPKA